MFIIYIVIQVDEVVSAGVPATPATPAGVMAILDKILAISDPTCS